MARRRHRVLYRRVRALFRSRDLAHISRDRTFDVHISGNHDAASASDGLVSPDFAPLIFANASAGKCFSVRCPSIVAPYRTTTDHHRTSAHARRRATCASGDTFPRDKLPRVVPDLPALSASYMSWMCPEPGGDTHVRCVRDCCFTCWWTPQSRWPRRSLCCSARLI